jgi:hypothetical protein
MHCPDPEVVEFLRQYLREYFPGQPLEVRASGIDALIVEVTDPAGKRRELRFSLDALPRPKSAPLVQFPQR